MKSSLHAYRLISIFFVFLIFGCQKPQPRYDIDGCVVENDREIETLIPVNVEPVEIKEVDIFQDKQEEGIAVDYPQGTRFYIFRFEDHQSAKEGLESYWSSIGDSIGDPCCVEVNEDHSYGFTNKPSIFLWTSQNYLFVLSSLPEGSDEAGKVAESLLKSLDCQ